MSTNIALLDSRKRLNLARYASSDVYLIDVQPSGRIVLEPADVTSRVERAVLASPRLAEQLESHDHGTLELEEEK